MQTLMTKAITEQSKDSMEDGGEPSGITKNTSDKVFTQTTLHLCICEKPLQSWSILTNNLKSYLLWVL